MPSYNIEDLNEKNDVLTNYYKNAKNEYQNFNWDDLDIIYKIVLENKSLSPKITLSSENYAEEYLQKWVKNYYDAHNNPPSKRIASPKGAATDPAIREIVKATQNLTDGEASIGELNHNLFMSAENIQGNLLEEFISSNVRDFGIIWCKGNSLRAIDFCNTDGALLLQIKNKSNTENSSSSYIRSGTTIKKWYRLGTKTKNKIKYPDFKWESLNLLINEFKTEGNNLDPCNLNEENYMEFLFNVASNNKNLITNK